LLVIFTSLTKGLIHPDFLQKPYKLLKGRWSGT